MGRYGTLVLKIEGVTLGDLPKTDLIGDADPYVRLSFGADSTARTKHIAGHELADDDRPQWNETLELDLPQSRTALRVEIHDHDPMPGKMADDDDAMAEGWVDLAPLIPSWASQPEPEMDSTSEHPRREESDDPDVLTYAVGLKTMETTLRGKKVLGGKPVSLQVVIVKLEVIAMPTPPTARNVKYATLGFTCGDKSGSVRYSRSAPAWALDKALRNACGIAYGATMQVTEPTKGVEYRVDPQRLPDGKVLKVELVSGPARIALSSKSSAMWFPTIAGLHSARSTASFPSMESQSSFTDSSPPSTDRSHYRGTMALKMASIPMPVPPPEAPLSARSFSSITAPEGQYKIVLLGDSGVGKSTFAERMANADTPREYRFDPKAEYAPTTAAGISQVTMTTTTGPIQLKFWELGGKCTTNMSSRRKAKNSGESTVYLAGSDAAIVFFSYKQGPEAYRNVLRWINLVRRTCGSIPLMVVGLGSDDKKSFGRHPEPAGGMVAASNKSGDNVYLPIVTLLSALENDSELRLKAHKKVEPLLMATDVEIVKHATSSWQADADPSAVVAEE